MSDLRYCQQCGTKVRTHDTRYRVKIDEIVRTRICPDCNNWFQTVEIDIDEYRTLKDVRDTLSELARRVKGEKDE